MSGADARALRADAWQIFAATIPGDDWATLVWAAGAARLTHCLYLAQIWAGHSPGSTSREGGSLPVPGRWYHGDRAGLHLTTAPMSGQLLVLVRWAEIEALARHAPQRHRDQAHAVLTRRRALTGEQDELWRRWQRGEQVSAQRAEAGQRWQRVEAECEALGALIWQHLRPTVAQLDLLSLLT